ncbi:MAG: hypothetical protein MK207_03630 [Saprospiraceae bacterium]|nr:hypothetical protein [Saprospiraceae bacterium]
MRILSLNSLKIICIVIIAFGYISCAHKPHPSTTVQSVKEGYRLLSEKQARKWIVTDSKEAFFEKVTTLEMSIQMKQTESNISREVVLEKYKKMLQDDLSEFTNKESEVVKQLFDKALDLCYQISPNINLPEIFLIKTKGNYYGSGVYYTRDNSIIIPSPMLDLDANAKNLSFLKTMIHEIFHIYSRYNKDKREALYKRIGFNKIPNLALSEFLQKRVLYNPDGVDLLYSINVKDSTGRSFKAIPVIYSKHNAYMESTPAFFSYLTFQLFEISKRDGIWSVKNKNIGNSIEDLTGFWEQVGTNTKYNIHPDEICADNFVIMAFAKETQGKNLKNLTNEGRQLIIDLETIITE